MNEVDCAVVKSCVIQRAKLKDIAAQRPGEYREVRTIEKWAALAKKRHEFEGRQSGQGQKPKMAPPQSAEGLERLSSEGGNRSSSAKDISAKFDLSWPTTRRILAKKLGSKSAKKVRGKKTSEKTRMDRLRNAKELLKDAQDGKKPLRRILQSAGGFRHFATADKGVRQ